MQCSSCGTSLPTGAAFCTNCGASVPNIVPGQGPSGTQYSEPSQAGNTVPAPSSYDATQIAPPSSQPAAPPTAYGTPSYGTPQQYAYGAPPPPPNPYGVSPSPDSYGAPPPPPNTYGAPPSPNAYGAPYAPPPGAFIPPSQPPTRRRGPRVGLIIGIVVLLLVLVGGGFLALRAANSGSQSNNNTATPTTTSSSSTTPAVTPTTQGGSPSGLPIDPTAAAIIINPQTASAIDNNFNPTKLTKSFTVGQTVYVTFHLALNGQPGYVQAKLYSGTDYIGDKILTVQSNFDRGYFTASLNQASTGTIELYWCTQSNCSDAKLATFVIFNVA